MLPTELLLDHRRSDDPTLLDALRDRDPLALAEAYHRTVPAAHACARRLLSSPTQIETLLRTVYRELWEDPPRDVSLEGWVRSRCYALGTDDLRERGLAPASPSVAAMLPDLPAPHVRYLDAAERALSELDERDRTVLLLAHDRGVAAQTQGGAAAAALDRSLRALAGPEPSSADAAALANDPCADVQGLGDWVLGLTSHPRAAELEALAASRPGCAALVRALRRGRRRLEGLPPMPDMGHRILVTVLAATAESGPAPSNDHQAATAESGPAPSIDHQPDTAESGPAPSEDHPAGLPPTEPADHAPPVRDAAKPDPADVTTGELALRELYDGGAEQLQAPWPEPATHRRRGDGTITSTEWRSGESTTAVATRDPGQPRVVRLPGDEDTGGFEARRRPNPYAQLAELDEDLRPDMDALMGTDEEELEDYESFYPEEELITRPSPRQRALVAIGYALPIILGGALGLYIADMLFSLNR
ncbi:MAG: hypothetical protein ACRD0K_18570 [Egibacteraceae bacterium]